MKKSFVQVMIANLINMVIALLNNFLLPKFLSVETYAMLKTYTLYISYVGFFHLGYIDGMYLKYGGKNLDEIDKEDFGSDFKNVVFMELIVGLIVATVAFVLHDSIILCFSLGMILNNVINCFQLFFQATGEFKMYGRALNAKTIIAFFGSIILIFIAGTDNYILYVVCQLIASFLPAIYLAVALNNRFSFLHNGKINIQGYKQNISSGFILMIGNFSSMLFTGIDRWFVKFLMSTATFAYYSFAVSVDSLVTTFISPVTVTLYNRLCNLDDRDDIRRIKRLILVWGLLVIALAFPAKWIVEQYLEKYIESVNIIIVLIGTQIFYAVIKGIYVNLFKARKKQKYYLEQMITMALIAAILDGVLYFFFRTTLAIAIGTFITALIWFLYNEIKGDINFKIKEYIVISICMAIYFFSGFKLNVIIGCIVYVLVVLLSCYILMRETLLYMFDYGKQFLLGVLHKIYKNRSM